MGQQHEAAATAEPAPSHPSTGERASPAPPVSAPSGFWGYTLVSLQLALIVLAVRTFEVGSRLHFFPVLCVAAGGFLVHACLPPRLRLTFFCLLSLAVVLFVLGGINGSLVIGLGGLLIAVCYLPVPFGLRAGGVALLGLAFAVARLDLNQVFWAVLGSMFMFRMIVFLYELKRAKERPPLGMTVAYFFTFPNVCFLFFPILDFKTFRDTYRPGARWQDAQTGVGFLAAGLSHLLAYRVVKYYVLPAPQQLTDPAHVALFLAANYALYLHVSGYFHIITGLLHLFGFAIPRTHHNYFLASSFTDVWRRINIPWKEFMAKVFFFPAFFAARRWGTRPAAIVAALWVFVVTWFLHSYQVFWITGNFPLGFAGVGLWLVAGALVAWNLQRDLDPAREIRPVPGNAVLGAFVRAARVVGMFALVSFFWACWNTPEVLVLVRAEAGNWRWLASGWPVAVALSGLVIVGAVAKLAHDRLAARGALPLKVSPAGSVGLHLVTLVTVLVLARPEVAGNFGPQVARRIAELSRESVTPLEAARAVRGYYEDIADAQVRPGALLADLEGRPPGVNTVDYRVMSTQSDPIIERELIPNWAGDVDGARLTINGLGMRDRPDLAVRKPEGVRRVAVTGSSMVMGWGVGDGEHFPRVLEDRLNARQVPNAPRYEVLNFGTGLSGPIQRRALIERKVFTFEPDVLLWVAHQDEFFTVPRHLGRLVEQGAEIPYPSLREVVRKAALPPDLTRGTAEYKLQALIPEILRATYRDVADECRRRGVRPVWVYLPMPGVTEVSVRSSEWAPLAKEAGFDVVNLEDWADGLAPSAVRVRVGDPHANSLGHRVIGEKLDAVLQKQPELLTPWPTGR